MNVRQFLLLLCSVLIAVGVMGQERSSPPSSTVEVKTEYDRFKDVTTVSVKPQLVNVTKADKEIRHVTIGALFGFAGQDLRTRPSSITLTFGVIADTWTISRENKPTLIVLVDGKKSFDGFASNTDRGLLDSGRVYEIFQSELPLSAVEKIATGNAVEMQLSTLEFKLADENLAALVALLKHTTQPK